MDDIKFEVIKKISETGFRNRNLKNIFLSLSLTAPMIMNARMLWARILIVVGGIAMQVIGASIPEDGWERIRKLIS